MVPNHELAKKGIKSSQLETDKEIYIELVGRLKELTRGLSVCTECSPPTTEIINSLEPVKFKNRCIVSSFDQTATTCAKAVDEPG
jgi:hypothetical protein